MELTGLQIKAILWDIRSQGVYLPSLQEDILDHICCLLEEEMQNTSDFKKAYIKVRNKIGPLVRLQYQTDEEISSHKRLERFSRIANYYAVSMYLAIGVFMLFGPILLSVIELSVIYGVLGLPLIIMGYVILFKRINYRKFDIIPFKESFSPVQMTF